MELSGLKGNCSNLLGKKGHLIIKPEGGQKIAISYTFGDLKLFLNKLLELHIILYSHNFTSIYIFASTAEVNCTRFVIFGFLNAIV